jgi:hypothetical protein
MEQRAKKEVSKRGVKISRSDYLQKLCSLLFAICSLKKWRLCASASFAPLREIF